SLLADKNHFPGIDIIRFGNNSNIILSRHTFTHVCLLDQLYKTLSLFSQYYTYEEIQGIHRITKSYIPDEAFREAVSNSFIHRDWSVKGNITVSMFDDYIEITSPGGLPPNITEENYLKGGLSISRNPILANIFFRLGFIERFGTGIPRIISSYNDMNLSPTFTITQNSISVKLPIQISSDLSNEEKQILELIKINTPMTRADISEALHKPKGQTIRLLNSLIAKHMIQRNGNGRNTTYSRT
ncbi:MAG: AAA family ATPase, partial [Eggerthellaceae bacterium]|nr:AAA family ATPase [Eggerthellaceae bacterium]